MISEGSRDTGNLSKDAENSALHHRNQLYLKIYRIQIKMQLFYIVIIFHNMTVFTVI